MSRKHNVRHPERGRSTYGKMRKALTADKYGQYRQGEQVTRDRLVPTIDTEEDEK